MERRDIDIAHFHYDAAQLRDHWLVLCAGSFEEGAFNAMTISWGSYGQIWNKMFFQVFVRPTRYTFEFMEKYDAFTLNAFEPKYKPALSIIGSKSGRNGNKIAEAGLTPEASRTVAAPCFKEASLVIECRKIYWQDIEYTHFLEPSIEGNYPKKDYHRMYFGEIVHVSRV
jgi:flavin reductase (DIM6/NTAB) family NADH-FMN oxidoreductase RutF